MGLGGERLVAGPIPMGPGPKRLRGTPFPPAHHQQEGPKGSGAVRAAWAAGDGGDLGMERHLSGGEGA